MSIDYDRQFKEISFEEALSEATRWQRERTYGDAKKAFVSAQRSEARGISVAFAKHTNWNGGYTTYYVWTGERS